MNERYVECGDFWKIENVGECYIAVLRDLANHLEGGLLLNYFNHEENILQSKRKDILNHLAERMRERANQLLNIQVYQSQNLVRDI